MKTYLLIISGILIFGLKPVAAQQLFIDTTKQNFINDSTGLNYYSALVGIKNTQEGNYQKFPATNDDEQGYSEEASEAPPLRKFKLDTITKAEFLKFKKNYKSGLDTSTSKLTWTDTSFIIKTENWQFSYETRISEDFSNNYYLGFIAPLNLYAIHGVDGHNEIGWLELTDKKTGKTYIFQSPSDYPFEMVNLSPKQTWFLGYVDDAYDGHCFISILKINRTKNNYTLTDYYGINLGQTWVKELVWANETSFVMACTREYSDITMPAKYYLKISFGK